jgi:hypothetical protein
MLSISWPQATEATMAIAIVIAVVVFPVDRPNNLANWPIPAAVSNWEPSCKLTRGVSLVFCDKTN